MKDRKTAIFILVMLVSLSVPAVFSKNDNFGVDYAFEPVMINGQWMIKDTLIQEIPGEPLVPYRAASILLPEGAVLKDVKVKHGEPIVQSGFDIPWGNPPCTFSDTPVKVGRNEETYSSDNLYPNKVFEVIGVEYFRGFGILNVHLFPVQYKPKSQMVKFYRTMTVEVKFGKGMKNKLYRGLKGDKKTVASMVDNPEVVGTYGDGPSPLQTYEYIIITNSTLASTFQTLADWKANFINGTLIIDVTDISDPAEIRNFIIDMYSNHGAKYVLLGGDTNVVPYRGFYVSTGGYTDPDMAADMYYAHLDGTFDDNGNGRYAEPDDGVDWYAEVAVGRAPVDSIAEAQNFINKVIAYEQAPKPHEAVLHASRLQESNDPDSRNLAWNFDDYIPPDWNIVYLFEVDGPITPTVWRNAWASNPSIFLHCGNGNVTCYRINYDPDVTWYSSDVASLTNTFWPWHTSPTCLWGQFEYDDCLAETYVMGPYNGAIACYANDNHSWFSVDDVCMYSGEFVLMQAKALFSDGKEKLGELLNQSKSYMVSSAQSNSTYRWCFYEINLLGDPESPCLTMRGGETVSCTVTITADYSGADIVEFYINGILVGTDTFPPFEYNWDTCLYEDGTYIIEIKGYASGGLIGSDTRVHEVNHYYVRITNPQEGETVSGTVPVTIDANCVDAVELYIDDEWVHTQEIENPHQGEPFQYEWDTTQYTDGGHIIRAEGYEDSVLKREVSIMVTVDNEPPQCLGTTLLFLLVLFGAAVTYRRR